MIKKTSSKKNKLGAGATVLGIAGLTAAAIGGYYLYGSKDAATNRAKVRGWMLRARGEVVEEFEKGKVITESAYMNAIDTVARKYNELKNVDIDDLEAFVEEMKGHWQGIKGIMKGNKKETKNIEIKTKNMETKTKNKKTGGK